MVGEDSIVSRDVTTARLGQPSYVAIRSVRIKVHDAPASPETLAVPVGATVVLGAGSNADVVITDASVSRKHLKLTVSEETIEIFDLDSVNGSYYQGQRIGRLIVNREATVTLGRVRVTIEPRAHLDSKGGSEFVSYGELVGNSTLMRDLFASLVCLENSLAPVMIEGAPGTGKTHIAREIHEHSPLRHNQVVTLSGRTFNRDSGGNELSCDLRQSRLSTEDGRAAFVELPRGGTLFIDEIDELSLASQRILLSTLKGEGVLPFRANRASSSPVRLIATARRNLDAEVQQGRFRQDLLMLLDVKRLRIPSLNERLGDVEYLARYFAAQCGVLSLPPKVIEQLNEHDWKDNVRELRSVVRGYAVIGDLSPNKVDAEAELAELLRRVLDLERPYQQQKDNILNTFMDVYLSMVLEKTGGNQSQASRISGIDRTYLNKMIARIKKSRS